MTIKDIFLWCLRLLLWCYSILMIIYVKWRRLTKLFCSKLWNIIICSRRIYGGHNEKAFYYIGGTLVFGFLSAVIFSYIYIVPNLHLLELEVTQRLVQQGLIKSVIQDKGMGCKMPELDPFSEEVMAYDEDLPKVSCSGVDVVQCVKSECFVDKELLKDMKDVVCRYQDIIYITDSMYYVDMDAIKVVGGDKYVLNRSDHVAVNCKWTDSNSLGLLSSRWYGYKAGFRPVEPDPVPPGRENSYNVLILGFDSASHNGFIRRMPKSYKFLSEKAVIMNGYNIVGDGTPAALFPILTGLAEVELPDARKHINNSYLNANQFIFHRLKKYGYRTAYFEDSPEIGTFQYRFNGFRRQPADHYLRAFLKEYARWPKLGSNKHCLGAKTLYDLFMDLATEFHSLDGKKFSFTFIGDISHDNFNLISSADDSLLAFLQSLVRNNVVEDTLVMVMSDHGSRYEGVRNTYQGKIEERLPIMAIMLPERLKTLRPDALPALQHNSEVLTTPFDIHATILDVLDLRELGVTWRIPGADYPRALSLLNPIPKSRTCGEAGVMPHWCACARWQNISQLDPLYNHVGEALATFIDGIIREDEMAVKAKCTRRSLLSIEWVMKQVVNDELLRYQFASLRDAFLGNPSGLAMRPLKEYYQAKIAMGPGYALFEGTVMRLWQKNSFIVNKDYISRVNAYGDEPSCISDTHPHLNKFCYCQDKLVNTTALAKDTDTMANISNSTSEVTASSIFSSN